MDGWDSATASSKKAFMDKLRTRWRSIMDRFNSDVRAEGQVRSGSASRTRTRYRYYHALQFLRPVLATRSTWSSTLQPGPGAVLHRTSSDPSQPSDSQEAPCRSATQTAGDQEAGPSGVPLSQVSATGYAGTTRQRQRALDRNVLPEFMHLSEAFNASLKSLSDRVESGFSLMERGFNQMEHRFHSVEQRLDRLEADLNRPVHHFFSKIEKDMAEHLSPEQQLNVLQACNNAFLQAMQHNRYGQQSVVSFPPVPPLTRFTSLPTCAAYHCTDTSIQSQDTHRYTTKSLSAAGHFTNTTMASAAPVWSTTATPMHAWSTATTMQIWNSPATTTTCSSPAATIPPARTSTATATTEQQPLQQQQPQLQTGDPHSIFAPSSRRHQSRWALGPSRSKQTNLRRQALRTNVPEPLSSPSVSSSIPITGLPSPTSFVAPSPRTPSSTVSSASSLHTPNLQPSAPKHRKK
ncbi:uncharacterized protein [Dendrobates tinctorius]|uniref:uncharacterized protein n=1 Tax=Dendrobates tinctorius TaxID=92724 RepID=UPI003CCA045A